MTQTTKYKLPQWEKADRIVMEDFNGMAAKLETALTAHDTALTTKADQATATSLQTQINQKADTSALDGLQVQLDAKSRIICGSYSGNNQSSQDIVLGVRPKVVLIVPYDGQMVDTGMRYGGMATDGGSCYYQGETFIQVLYNGFRVFYNSSNRARTNAGGTFYYLAVC